MNGSFIYSYKQTVQKARRKKPLLAITNAQEFVRILKQQPLSRSAHFIIYCFSNKELTEANQKKDAYLGLIVPKQYLRRAVDRNRIKRIVREVFRQQQDQLVERIRAQETKWIVRLYKYPRWAQKPVTEFRHNCRTELQKLLHQIMLAPQMD